ncbi:MAG TPA: hypothetical protein DCL66_11855 [Gammaproteobacteria bacterium]|nr:hypothetical protein [Gammaproteobacteria bacterium]
MKKIIKNLAFLITASLSIAAIAQPQDTVGFKYDVVVSNPLAVVAAFDKYRSGAAGTNSDVVVTLHQYLANGTSPATHAVTVAYSSPQVMDAALAAQATSPEWAVFQLELRRASEIFSSTMWRSLGLNAGNSDVQNAPMAAGNWVYVNVDDPAAYAAAWQEWVDAEASEDSQFALIAIAADGADGATHAVINTARSPGAQFAQRNDQTAFTKFRKSVSGIREVKERVRLVKVKSW